MKKRIIAFIEALVFITVVIVAGYQFYTNYRLQGIIDKQSGLIKRTTGKDSEFIEKAKSLTDSIESVTNDINFIVNGKKITSDQFIKVYDRLNFRNDSLQQEYDILKTKYKVAEDNYGFKIKVTEYPNKRRFEPVSFTRADSASVAHFYFKDRITIKNKKWYIKDVGLKETKASDAKLQEATKKNQDIIDSADAIIKRWKKTP